MKMASASSNLIIFIYDYLTGNSPEYVLIRRSKRQRSAAPAYEVLRLPLPSPAIYENFCFTQSEKQDDDLKRRFEVCSVNLCLTIYRELFYYNT